jgi:DNA-binding transcriptional ArsR family regulator
LFRHRNNAESVRSSASSTTGGGVLVSGTRDHEDPAAMISVEANRVSVSERVRPARSRSRRLTPGEVERLFGALSHEARRQIVLVLSHYGPELPSGYLAKRFTHSWPTTTRHLHVLEAAGVVSVRSEGRNCWCRLNQDYLRRVVGECLELLAPPTRDQIWRSPGSRSLKKGPTS